MNFNPFGPKTISDDTEPISSCSFFFRASLLLAVAVGIVICFANGMRHLGQGLWQKGLFVDTTGSARGYLLPIESHISLVTDGR
jgi:hypothetical protein